MELIREQILQSYNLTGLYTTWDLESDFVEMLERNEKIDDAWVKISFLLVSKRLRATNLLDVNCLGMVLDFHTTRKCDMSKIPSMYAYGKHN